MNYKLSPSDLTLFCRGHRVLLKVLSILLLIPTLTGCAASPSPTLADMETIDKGEYSGIMTREQLVMKSLDEWGNFWDRHTSVHVPALNAPEVDFSKEMIIAVFSGEKPTGGYSIEITEVEFAEDEVTIFFEEVLPEPGEPVTEALTQPFHIVKINRSDDLPVKFMSEYSLEKEFILYIDESVVIAGEDLRMKFVEVSEDSRCPKDVTCIWEGRVTAVIEISTDGSSQQLELSQPGLTDAPARETYEGYEITYRVEPYPEKAEVEIAADEYRLLLIVSSTPKPLQTEADFTGWVTEIHPIGNKGTLGQILVEAHADKIVDKYMVTIKDETLILQQDGEKRSQAAFEVLETAQQVPIWFTGPIMESFPMQGTAQQVVIVLEYGE